MNLTGIVLAGGKSSRLGFNKLKTKVGPIPLFIDQIFKLSFFCAEIIVSTSKNNYPIVSSELNKIRIYQKKYNFGEIQASKIKKYLKTNYKNFHGKALTFPDIRIVLDENNADNSNTGNSGRHTLSQTDRGPVIGIYTSLARATYFYSIVVAFDMPFISYNLLKWLANDVELNIKEQGNNKSTPVSSNYSKVKAASIIKTEKGFETLCGLYSRDCLDILKRNIEKQKYKISDIFDYLDIEIISNNKLEMSRIDNLNFFNINRIQDYYKFKNLWQNKEALLNTGSSFVETWADFFFR